MPVWRRFPVVSLLLVPVPAGRVLRHAEKQVIWSLFAPKTFMCHCFRRAHRFWRSKTLTAPSGFISSLFLSQEIVCRFIAPPAVCFHIRRSFWHIYCRALSENAPPESLLNLNLLSTCHLMIWWQWSITCVAFTLGPSPLPVRPAVSAWAGCYRRLFLWAETELLLRLQPCKCWMAEDAKDASC